LEGLDRRRVDAHRLELLPVEHDQIGGGRVPDEVAGRRRQRQHRRERRDGGEGDVQPEPAREAHPRDVVEPLREHFVARVGIDEELFGESPPLLLPAEAVADTWPTVAAVSPALLLGSLAVSAMRSPPAATRSNSRPTPEGRPAAVCTGLRSMVPAASIGRLAASRAALATVSVLLTDSSLSSAATSAMRAAAMSAPRTWNVPKSELMVKSP